MNYFGLAEMRRLELSSITARVISWIICFSSLMNWDALYVPLSMLRSFDSQMPVSLALLRSSSLIREMSSIPASVARRDFLSCLIYPRL